jgi:hypothetical protein
MIFALKRCVVSPLKQAQTASAYGYQHLTFPYGVSCRSLRCELLSASTKQLQTHRVSFVLTYTKSAQRLAFFQCEKAKTEKELCEISRCSAKFHTTTRVKFHSAEDQIEKSSEFDINCLCRSGWRSLLPMPQALELKSPFEHR